LTDIVKGALAGAWTLSIGWILPAALGLGVFGLMVLPSIGRVPVFEKVSAASAGDQALILLATAVLLGITLSSLSTPLYRVLEGYSLWPASLQMKGIQRHRSRRAEARRSVRTSSDTADLAVTDALALEAFHRYPDADDQVAPTLFGNAIRRFEYYSSDRYRLDSQLLWSQLRGVVPESVSKEVDNARAGVDFFVCLFYTAVLLALSGSAAMFAASRDSTTLAIAVALGILSAIGSYHAAIKATDAWSSAVRAMVDLGRVPLAKALGLELPPTLGEEREMWLRVGWVLGFAHDARGVQALDAYRVSRNESAEDEPKPN
jgi:hypothetical protein